MNRESDENLNEKSMSTSNPKSLADLLGSDAANSSNRKKGMAATVGGDRVVTKEEKGEIYIRADGKKVRRIKKTVVKKKKKESSDDNEDGKIAATVSTDDDDDNASLVSYMSQGVKKKKKGKKKGIASTSSSISSGLLSGNENDDDDNASLVSYMSQGVKKKKKKGKKTAKASEASAIAASAEATNSTSPIDDNNDDDGSVVSYMSASGAKRKGKKSKKKKGISAAATIAAEAEAITAPTKSLLGPPAEIDNDDDASLISYMSTSGVKKKKKKKKNEPSAAAAIANEAEAAVTKDDGNDDDGSVVSYMSASGTKRKKKKSKKKKENSAGVIAAAAEANNIDVDDDQSLVSYMSTSGVKRKKKKGAKGKLGGLEGFLNQGGANKIVQPSSDDDDIKKMSAEGEIYINKDGKKVRRVRKMTTKSTDDIPSSSLSGLLGATGSAKASGPATVAGDRVSTIESSSEVYINKDGKKVRRVKKTVTRVKSKHESGDLSNMLESGAGSKMGAATVSGSSNAGSTGDGEVYINKDGKKVRRIRKTVLHSTDSTTSGSLGEMIDGDNANRKLVGSATVSGETEIYIRPDGKKVRRVKRTPSSTTASLSGISTSTPGSNVAASVATGDGIGEIYINKDGKKVRRVRRSASSTAPLSLSGAPSITSETASLATPEPPRGTEPLSSTELKGIGRLDGLLNDQQRPKYIGAKSVAAPHSTVNVESEIYINKDGKKVRRVRRTPSSSPSGDLGALLNGNGVSKPGASGGATIGGDRPTNSASSDEGEIYIRADGKKVRRVRRSTSALAAANPSNDTTGHSLKGFLDNNELPKNRLMDSATVAGDKISTKLDGGEIVIRADGKKVIRRARNKEELETEVYRRADGKLVRRVKKVSNGGGSDLKQSVASKQDKTPAVPTVQLTADEEKIATEYRKMKKMGLPDDAVRHKMNVSDVHPKIIAAVLGDKWTEPSTTNEAESTTLALAPVHHLTTNVQLTGGEEALAIQYRKLKHLGLPDDEVRQKMVSHNVDPKIIAAVFDEEWPPASSSTPTVLISAENDHLKSSLSNEASNDLSLKSQPIFLQSGQTKLKSTWPPKNEATPYAKPSSSFEPSISQQINSQSAPSSSTSVSIKLTEEEEDVANEYRKMKRMGLPNDAVRHKMVLGEVDPRIISAVLGDEFPTQSTTNASLVGDVSPTKNFVSSGASPAASPAAQSNDNEEVEAAEQISKIETMGLPNDAIRMKILVDDQSKVISVTVGGPSTTFASPDLAPTSVSVPRVATLEETTHPSTPALGARLTEEEEAVAAEFRNMQRMGLPDDSVRQKMVVGEVDPKIISAVLGDEHTTQPEIAHDAKIVSQGGFAQLTEAEEAIADEFKKMKRMGLTDDAVRHRMLISNVDQKIISVVLGEEPINVVKDIDSKTNAVILPPQDSSAGRRQQQRTTQMIVLSPEEVTIAGEYKMMQKMGLSDAEVRCKMQSKDVDSKIIAAVLGSDWEGEPALNATPLPETAAVSSASDGRMQELVVPASEATGGDETAEAPTTTEPHETQQLHTPIQLDDDEEAEAEQYRKMQKMYIPNEIIRQKMIAMEVHPKVMAAVLGEVWVEPPAIIESPVIQQPPAHEPVQLDDDEETDAAPYRKMIKMGLPNDVVRHKMVSTEVHPKIMAAVLGEGWVEPPATTATPAIQQMQAPMSVELDDDEEAEAAHYRKMLKMGLPEDVVRHKMVSSDVHPKIMAAVLGDKWIEPPAHTTETAGIQQPQVSVSIELNDDEEADAAHYRKMLKMGLPSDVVRQKMVSSDVSPKIIAAVLGEEWTEPPAPTETPGIHTTTISKPIELSDDEEAEAAQYRKMLRLGLPNDSVRHKMLSVDVHPKIIAAVLGDEWIEPSRTTESQVTPQPQSPISIELSDDEEAEAAPYRKMLKMGLPNDVVRHKMASMDVRPKVVAAVLGEEWADPSETTAMQTQAPKPIELNDHEEEEAAQYRKMLKMGLPNDVVRHKMSAMGTHPKIIAAVLGEEWSEPAQAPVPFLPASGVPATLLPLDAKVDLPGPVAYIVVVGDDPSAQQQARLPTASLDDDFVVQADEKFAVKIADHASSGTPKTKFITLSELAKMSGQTQSELEAIVKEKKQRSASPPRFVLQSMPEQTYEVEIPEGVRGSPDNGTAKASGRGREIKEGEEVVDSALASAARAVSALGDGDMNALIEKLQAGDMAELLAKLREAEKRQKKLEKQLQQAGVAIAEDIDYAEAKSKVEQIAKRMNEIGGSDVVAADKEEQNKLREEYFKLEQEMERYNTALMLSEEYQSEQDRLAKKWEEDNEAGNLEALRRIRRHMPVMIRHMSEADLANKPSPNGKYLPKAIAKKFKRTNVLQCLRINPLDLERMHPCTLENMRVTGLTLTERRAVYLHLRTLGPKWEKNKAEKMTERKWTWYQMMKNNFKENLEPYLRHCAQYGPPDNHPYATRDNPGVGCPLMGKQCPVRADKEYDYSGDYGYPDGDEYELSDVKKSDCDDPGAKAKAEAAGLAREKKANERADILKKHYKGKLLQVSKANGSCENMDEAMDRMENHTMKWIEFIIQKGNNETAADKQKEVANFTEALNELKLSSLDFAARSGMQMSGKKKAGGDAPDIRSSVEASLSEETFECTRELFSFIKDRMTALDVIDTRVSKTIDMLDAMWSELHEKNLALIAALGAKRSNRSRKLKKNADLRKEVEDKQKPEEDEPAAEEAAPPRPPMGGGGRGGLLDGIKGRGGGGGRGGLLDAISGRGRGRGGGDGGGGRGGLLDSIKGGRGRGGGGGRGDLLSSIAGRGRGRGGGGGEAGGRGGLLAAIASRGGGDA